jgi:hypothetical protein
LEIVDSASPRFDPKSKKTLFIISNVPANLSRAISNFGLLIFLLIWDFSRPSSLPALAP